MTTRGGARIRAAVGGAFALLLAGAGVGSAAKNPPRPKATCCFTNPAYVGACEVQPSRSETCASILAYLNKATSAGKTYCDATTVRGGWVLAQCRTAPASPKTP